jgi:hypothetical protein
MADPASRVVATGYKQLENYMILQPIHGRLRPDNCVIILMDYQSQFALSISSSDGDILVHNATNLAKIGKTFNIPTLLTTLGESSFGGPIFSNIQEIFPDQKPLDRTALSIFEDTHGLTAMEKIGRDKLVIA